ncbi:MAG: ribosomal RNA small subunit methyltransferase A [Anaerolineales bacterium]|nr:ribosomal RNA small subunit methyltransferase A [Anaerolineales bacterium]
MAPKKSLGQNFLHDPHALGKIVAAAELTSDEAVLEIGAGTGALTVPLAQTNAPITAVEIDERLIPILAQQLADFPNVRIVHTDILDHDPARLVGEMPYVVVANLPYYITSLILRGLLERASRKPRRLVLTIQQEVAERITAKPGDMSLLAVSVQFYGVPKIVGRISAGAFFPRPEVDSAILRVDLHPTPAIAIDEAAFFTVVRAGFAQKRKQLKNALGSGLGISHPEAAAILTAAGIDPARRAETLTLPEWGAVTTVATQTLPALS